MKNSSPLFDIDDSLEAILRFADHCMDLSETLHRRIMRLDFLKNDLGFVLSLAFMRLFVISSRLLDYASHPVPYRPRAQRASRAGEYRNCERSLAARLDDPFGILAQVNMLAVKGRHMIRRDQAARFGPQKTVFPGKRSAGPGSVHISSVPKLPDPGSSPGIRGGVAKSGAVATECVSRVKAVFPGKQSADPGTVDAFSVPQLPDPGSSPGIRRGVAKVRLGDTAYPSKLGSVFQGAAPDPVCAARTPTGSKSPADNSPHLTGGQSPPR
ncbi:MAG: hypothetical protein AAFW83_06265 [Pseudomonadota bacterium]